MKLILQTALCCSLLLTFTLTVETTKQRLSSEMKKRLNAWLQNRVRRDLISPVDSEQFVRPEDVRDSLNPHMSTDISIRAKRSKNSVSQTKRASSCSLSTCAMNDLMDRLSKLSNQMRIGNVPINKIGPIGYGRRRRSLPASQGSPRLHRGRNSHARSLEVLLRRT